MKKLPGRLSRYADLANFFWWHARPAINHSDPLSEINTDPEKHKEQAEAFAESLESMGPTYVKFGQLLSTRSDILSGPYVKALERLQDGVEELPYETIEEVFQEELEVSISKVFAEFDKTPIASASLGQTHRAKTREGQEVVVKVQRPGIRKQIVEDLDTLESLAGFVDEHSEAGQRYRFSDMVDQFRQSLLDELNYNLEAKNLLQLAEDIKKFKGLCVPAPHLSFCSERVLTMEYISGQKITDTSGVKLTELDGSFLVDQLLQAFLEQFLVTGFFHADPHPGNLFLTEDDKIAFIDLGMVGRLSGQMCEQLFDLFSGICDNESERVVEVIMHIGLQENHTVDRQRLNSEVAVLVSRSQNVSVKELQFGTVVMRIVDMCTQHGIILPREITMVGKVLLNLDRVGITLAPDFNPSESIRNHLSKIATKRSLDALKPGDLLSALKQMKELVQRSPKRINDILDNLADNKFRIDVDAVDETALIQGFQKIANRITMGVIVASMVIAAALIMNIDSNFQIFGYSGFAMILFSVAAIFGAFVVVGILRNDR